jgi:hypothetical protein
LLKVVLTPSNKQTNMVKIWRYVELIIVKQQQLKKKI